MIHNKIEMTENERKMISELIEKEMGIKMPPCKKIMLESRLIKRVNHLGLKSYKEYYKYLTSDEGYKNEILAFVDAVSTNKTDFFREPKHWTYMNTHILPDLVNSGRFKNGKLRIWSSACSTGEEPYTIAMLLDDFLSKYKHMNIDYSILASDISVDVLNKAYRAVYEKSLIEPIPYRYKMNYLMRNINNNNYYRIVPELRAKVKFRRINLNKDSFNIEESMDIIFCRNVLIYFTRDKQEEIIKKLVSYLKRGGYLLIGHSESMIGYKVNLVNIIPTIYRKP